MFYIILLLNLTIHKPVVKVTPYKTAIKYLLPKKTIKEINKSSIPSKFDLCDKLPKVASQNWQGSCVAWASGYYYKTFQEAREHNWDVNDKSHICSPAFVYNQINSGNDDGSFPLDALRLIRTSGCASWSDMPYNPDDNKTLPDKEQQLKALKWRGDNFYFFYANTNNIASGKRTIPVDDEVINAMKHHIANGDAFVISIPYFEDFGRLNTNFYTKDHNEITHPDGGHALVVCGYDDNINGQGGFRVKNSWGTSWGENGLAYLSYEFIKYFSQEALFMTDRINYIPEKYAEIDIEGIPRSQISFIFLGKSGTSPQIDFLRFDFRNDFHQIIDLTDIKSDSSDDYLINLLDMFEDENKGTLKNLKIKKYETEEILKDYEDKLPLTMPDLGDIDITGENYTTIHYDKNAYDDTTMGGKENKSGYLGIEFYFRESGIIKAIDFFTPYNNMETEIYIYNSKEDFLNNKGNYLYNEKLFPEKQGWHTHWLNKEIKIASGTIKFIVIKYTSDKGNVIPIEAFTNQYAYTYYSLDGKTLSPLNYAGKIRIREFIEEFNDSPSLREETDSSSCSFGNKKSFPLLTLILFLILFKTLILKYKKLKSHK